MHIHEINPKRTAITLLIFAVVIIFGLLTVVNPRLKYEQTIEQTIELVVWEEGTVFPYELVEVIDGTIDTILLVDLRDTFQYGKGHIPGSENISSVDLLKKENIKRLEQLKKDGMAVVVYANNQLDANGPWMVLRQLGFDNIKILLGGYLYYKQWQDNIGDSYADDAYFLGGADHDYAEVASEVGSMGTGSSDEAVKEIKVMRKKKKAVAEGGC